MKQFNAVKDLYDCLVRQYSRLGVTNREFEEGYVASHCFLERKVTEFLRQADNTPIIIDMSPTFVTMCLDELVKMEKSLYSLRGKD